MKHYSTYQSQFIEMQMKSGQTNSLGDFIERCTPNRCGERTDLPILSVTKDKAIVFQDERFGAVVASNDKSNYIIAPRGYLVQGIHIDESNFGIQNLVDEGIVSPAYKLWRFKNSNAIPELIEYYLRSEMSIKYFRRKFLGATVPRRQVIRKEDFLDLPLNLPNMEEQKKYFRIYQQADKSKFTSLKSQFIEMFQGEFPTEKWKDCLSITNGKKYDGDYQESGSYPICGSGGIIGYGEQILCPKNTVILGRKGNINSPIFMESDYWIVDTAFCLDVDGQKLQPKYFYYWCKLFDFTRYNKQGVLPSLTKNDLLRIEMPVPPMNLQNKFVDILNQADKSKFISLKSQFIEMFEGDKYPKTRLGDFVSIRTGKLDANASSENGKYPFFTCGVETLKIDDYAFDCEAVLLAGNGEFCVKYYNGKFNAYQRTYVIETLDNNVISVPYLYAWFGQYAKVLRGKAIGGIIKYIKMGDLTEAKISFPPLEVQNIYVAIAQQADKSKFELRKSIEAIDAVIKSLING